MDLYISSEEFQFLFLLVVGYLMNKNGVYVPLRLLG